MTIYIYNPYKDLYQFTIDVLSKVIVFDWVYREVFYINPLIEIDTPPPRK